MILRSLNLLDDRLRILLNHVLKDCIYHQLPFDVFETGRTLERQKQLKAKGVSKTLNSKHLVIIKNGIILQKSKAVDLVLHCKYNGKMVWSWANYGDKAQRDRDMAYYKMLSVMITTRYPELLKKSFINRVINGGQWKHFKDWPHVEID